MSAFRGSHRPTQMAFYLACTPPFRSRRPASRVAPTAGPTASREMTLAASGTALASTPCAELPRICAQGKPGCVFLSLIHRERPKRSSPSASCRFLQPAEPIYRLLTHRPPGPGLSTYIRFFRFCPIQVSHFQGMHTSRACHLSQIPGRAGTNNRLMPAQSLCLHLASAACLQDRDHRRVDRP